MFCAVLLMALAFVTSRSTSERVRIVLVAIVGAWSAAAFVAALLSIDQVADAVRGTRDADAEL